MERGPCCQLATQEVLDFGEGGSSSIARVKAHTSMVPQRQVAMVSDLDDLDQEALFKGFDGEYNMSSTSSPPSPISFYKRPLRELGIYDATKDTSG